jgi:hypothetical protein
MSSLKAIARSDKFSGHFKERHDLRLELGFRTYQCMLKPCFYGLNRGGLFFTSAEGLQRHKVEEHASSSTSQSPTAIDISKFSVLYKILIQLLYRKFGQILQSS